MLTLRTLKSADDEAARALNPSVMAAAFAQGKATLDYLLPDPYWTGTAPALRHLGLVANEEVTAGPLTAAIAGRNTRTGRPVRGDGEACDLTFIAPPSVSWVWSQADADLRMDLEWATLGAASRCVHHLVESRPLADGEQSCQGFAAALVLHAVGTTSPQTPPLLHVHTYLVGVLDSAGTLRGPHPGALYEASLTREGGAVGRAVLAESLDRLGFELTALTGHRGRSFEIADVPEGLLEAGRSADKGCAGLGEETDQDWRYHDVE